MHQHTLYPNDDLKIISFLYLCKPHPKQNGGGQQCIELKLLGSFVRNLICLEKTIPTKLNPLLATERLLGQIKHIQYALETCAVLRSQLPYIVFSLSEVTVWVSNDSSTLNNQKCKQRQQGGVRDWDEATEDLVILLIDEVHRQQIVISLPDGSAGLVQQKIFKAVGLML